ncbi:MAG: AAA domain-containing protein [Waterburya sp.]
MSETAKSKQLLSAWIDYIYLEDLSNASVDAVTPKGQNIWFKGVSLIGDRLLLPKSLFQELKEQYFSNSAQKNQQDIKLAVAFPQIYLVQKKQRHFRPLFTIDVSSIFLGRFRSRGWDLTEYNFQPVIPNLMELSRLDEEEVENLVTKEGLKVFLETTFKHPFSTLQDFLELIELPSSSWCAFPSGGNLRGVASASLPLKHSPYLLRFDFVPANNNLKKDLKKISDSSYFPWAVRDHPAYEYLFGQPQPPRHEVLFFGAFPTEPPNKAQATALKHQSENCLTAVIGPPGTGKTTLLLHSIAVSLVERAYQLALTGIDRSNLTLITSTNNRAVSNVLERLDALPIADRFYLPGGKKDFISQQVMPKLQAASDWLSDRAFDETEWSQTSSKLIAGVKELQQQLELDRESARQKEQDICDIEKLRIELQAIDSQIEAIEQQVVASSDYDQYPKSAYEQILPHLEKAVRSLSRTDFDQLPTQNQTWWQRLWYFLIKHWQKITKTSTHHIVERLRVSIRAPLTATLATPFPFRLPLNREELKAASVAVADQLSSARAMLGQQPQNQIDSLRGQRDELRGRLKQIEQQLASYPTEDFYTRFPQEHHQLQVQLFELSWQFLLLEAVRRSDEVIASVRAYMDVITPDWNYEARRKFAQHWSTILKDVSLLFPVFASTLQSIRNLLPYTDSGCIDRLYVDEAGMIPLHQLFPALVRCNKAMVVGDPLQLEPIIPFSQSTIEQYHFLAFTERGLSNTDYERYSPTAISTATAYHRAAGVFGESTEAGNGIILTEHHRCVPPIIAFSERLCRYGLVLKTPENPSKLGSNLIAYHVEGNYDQHTNPQEIEAICSLMEHLFASGYCICSPSDENTIGVISPYRAQADVLHNSLQQSYPDLTSDSIGTVHTFQGGQKSVIILSTRQCRTTDSFWFINRRPNLLNVAVSRAQELFILVGNLELLQQSGGYTRMLVEHIQNSGEIRQLP